MKGKERVFRAREAFLGVSDNGSSTFKQAYFKMGTFDEGEKRADVCPFNVKPDEGYQTHLAHLTLDVEQTVALRDKLNELLAEWKWQPAEPKPRMWWDL